VALGDTIYLSDRAESVTKQCIDTFSKFNNPVIALQKIPRYLFKSHGMVKGRVVEERVWKIDDMVEKPKPEDSPSNLAITGTYILTPDIFDCIKETKARAGKKIQLTDSLKILAQKRMVFGYEFEGRRFEVGSKLDWFKADLCLKLERPEFRDDMRDFINEIMKERSG